MKKTIIFSITALTAAAAFASAAPLNTMAAERPGSNRSKVVTVNVQNMKGQRELMEKSGYSFPGGNCIIINKPSLPGSGNSNCPNKPGTGNPNCPNKPGTGNPNCPNKPDNGKPDSPDTGNPDNPDTGNPNPDQPGTDNPNPDQPGTDSPSVAFAEQVVALVNQERAKAGLNPLTLQKDVEGAAMIRAKEIKSSFSHTRPDGRNFTTALEEQGVRYRGAGENIAWGQKSPQQVMDGWMNSEGHRANILNAKFTQIGVGHYQDAGTNYWTQLFTY